MKKQISKASQRKDAWMETFELFAEFYESHGLPMNNSDLYYKDLNVSRFWEVQQSLYSMRKLAKWKMREFERIGISEQWLKRN